MAGGLKATVVIVALLLITASHKCSIFYRTVWRQADMEIRVSGGDTFIIRIQGKEGFIYAACD